LPTLCLDINTLITFQIFCSWRTNSRIRGNSVTSVASCSSRSVTSLLEIIFFRNLCTQFLKERNAMTSQGRLHKRIAKCRCRMDGILRRIQAGVEVVEVVVVSKLCPRTGLHWLNGEVVVFLSSSRSYCKLFLERLWQ